MFMERSLTSPCHMKHWFFVSTFFLFIEDSFFLSPIILNSMIISLLLGFDSSVASFAVWCVQIIFLQVNGKVILKSGTDFREFSELTLTQESKEVNVDIKKVVVDSSFEPDADLKEALIEFEGES